MKLIISLLWSSTPWQLCNMCVDTLLAASNYMEQIIKGKRMLHNTCLFKTPLLQRDVPCGYVL